MNLLIGDIGNTETKICILNENYKIIKRLNLSTKKINNKYFFKKKIFSFLKKKNYN